ncbi:MAG: hypothetical protein ACRDH9_01320 [Actinomycetota bacterium]
MTPTRRRRPIAPTIATCLATLVASWIPTMPATAAIDTPVPAGILRRAADARAQTLSRLAPVRRELGSGGVASAVRAAMALGRVEPVALPRQGPGLRAPAGIPTSIAPAVEGLLSAMDRASRASTDAIQGNVSLLAERAAELSSVAVTRSAAHGTGTGVAITTTPDDVRRFLGGLDRIVDRRLLYSAALEVAASIDAALPPLIASSFARPARGASLAECDVAQVGSRLCIGGSGPNTYTHDFELLIDQGGDDLYLNAAAGAEPLVNRIATAVVIDVSGNDTYRSSVPRSDSFVAQGSGRGGGIGILVDAAGDDEFTATVAEQPPAGTTVSVCAMGCGDTGVGVLADLGGADRYTVSNTAPSVGGTYSPFGDSWEFERANGLAFGSVGGLGVVADRGGSNDSYLVECRPTPVVKNGELHGGEALASGAGYAITGAVALFADDGGIDDVVSTTVISPEADIGIGQARGMGVGATGGSAAAIAGDGKTHWTLHANDVRVTAGRVASEDIGIALITLADAVVGQGAGTLGGFGSLYDAGGDDSFIAAAEARVRYAGINDGAKGAVVRVAAPPTITLAQGLGDTATGALVDAGGDDAYTLAGTSHADATATDREATESGPTAEALSGNAQVYGQGGGVGLAANGLLLDRSGDDTYRAEGSSRATAAAEPWGDGPAEGIATSGIAWNFVQTAQFSPWGRFASLQDLGGDDSYWSSASATAQATPPTKVTEPSTGGVASSAQAVANGIGLFLDLDGGSQDTFTSVPPRNPAVGSRGVGVWVSSTGSVGINA